MSTMSSENEYKRNNINNNGTINKKKRKYCNTVEQTI